MAPSHCCEQLLVALVYITAYIFTFSAQFSFSSNYYVDILFNNVKEDHSVVGINLKNAISQLKMETMSMSSRYTIVHPSIPT